MVIFKFCFHFVEAGIKHEELDFYHLIMALKKIERSCLWSFNSCYFLISTDQDLLMKCQSDHKVGIVCL